VIRDASVDPQPGDFMPMREPKGRPGERMHAVVGTDEYEAAVEAWRRNQEES